ncbi:MAG: hypothetical protein A2632_02065 [Candidatus Pacebacteria bacterium RIFCSPHIGHO2_01_FULL_46_16]|nr:MAG: hypothetical protein A2632_02065 [Candidatus Pacebacteria bacterium RIFCSPHIGHO2_01_FULL_46_16]OGJ21585.1 MAG: hypothetical protein A3J60_03865 [Candidatus Pacebacteria bacterium RIFCSPHIGHO2_02_FULL_46_9]OGJ37385.1 MAG: hypothetical protein A3A82_02665 [Candidatus Pacebacteria bacterium RIFCSPLOWO2_01_FULL_47_12]
MPKDLPDILTEKTQVSFSVPQLGLYAISITAGCKGRNDLRIEIDDRLFREIPPKENTQRYDIPPAWNGSKLNGLKQTNIFLLKLDRDEHTITFYPKGQVIVEEWTHSHIENPSAIIFNFDQSSENGDKRPWFTFILVDLPLISISAEIDTSWHLFDGDDVKVIIDNEVEHNPDSTLWRDWVWHATPGQIFTGSKKEQKVVAKDLPKGIHYIEFWADKTPTLHKVIFDLGTLESGSNQAKSINAPTVENPKWTGDFADDTETMILARLIFGEARNQSRETIVGISWVVKNRVEAKRSYFGEDYHGVVLKSSKGIYQFSPFNPTNSNYLALTNPLSENADPLTEKAWFTAYEVAS